MSKIRIICSEADFSRMLEIQLILLGHTVTDSETGADAVIVDLDEYEALPVPVAQGNASYVGFTRHSNALGSETSKKYRIILHRPFTMSEFSDAMGVSPYAIENRAEKSNISIPSLNRVTRQFTYEGLVVSLSENEAVILSLLLASKGRAVSREELAHAIGGCDSNMVDVYVCYLRKKIDEKLGRRFIFTARRVGYIIK